MKQVILNEEQFKTFVNEANLLNLHIIKPKMTEKQYAVSKPHVMLIKNFLDKGFMRGSSEDLGPEGFPIVTPCFGQLDSTGNVLRNLNQDEMIELLMDKYETICAEEEETKRLLNRVLEDWFNHKIKKDGSLSVNYV